MIHGIAVFECVDLDHKAVEHQAPAPSESSSVTCLANRPSHQTILPISSLQPLESQSEEKKKKNKLDTPSRARDSRAQYLDPATAINSAYFTYAASIFSAGLLSPISPIKDADVSGTVLASSSAPALKSLALPLLAAGGAA